MELSRKLKELRKSNKLSQGQLARILNVTNQAVSKWETGKSYPDILNLVKLSDIFDVSLDELIKNDINVQKSLYNKSGIKNFHIVILGIILAGISYRLFCYFETIHVENSFTNWIVNSTGLVGITLIGYTIYVKLTKSLKNFLS